MQQDERKAEKRQEGEDRESDDGSLGSQWLRIAGVVTLYWLEMPCQLSLAVLILYQVATTKANSARMSHIVVWEREFNH